MCHYDTLYYKIVHYIVIAKHKLNNINCSVDLLLFDFARQNNKVQKYTEFRKKYCII